MICKGQSSQITGCEFSGLIRLARSSFQMFSLARLPGREWNEEVDCALRWRFCTDFAVQIKTHEQAEQQYIEQMELVNQLKAENTALQQDARAIASLQAEVADLKAKVSLRRSNARRH